MRKDCLILFGCVLLCLGSRVISREGFDLLKDRGWNTFDRSQVNSETVDTGVVEKPGAQNRRKVAERSKQASSEQEYPERSPVSSSGSMVANRDIYLELDKASNTIGLDERNAALLTVIIEAECAEEVVQYFISHGISLPVPVVDSKPSLAYGVLGTRLLEELGLDKSMRLTEKIIQSRELAQLKSIILSEFAYKNPEKALGKLVEHSRKIGEAKNMVAFNLSHHVPLRDLGMYLEECIEIDVDPREVLQANAMRLLNDNPELMHNLAGKYVKDEHRDGFAFCVASAYLAQAESFGSIEVDTYLDSWEYGQHYWRQAINVLAEMRAPELVSALEVGSLEYTEIPQEGLTMLAGTLAREHEYNKTATVLSHLEDNEMLMDEILDIWVSTDIENVAEWAPTLSDKKFRSVLIQKIIDSLEERSEKDAWLEELNR